MTESSSRLLLTLTGTFASICYILAIFFGLRGDQAISVAFFIAAILDSGVAFWAWRVYSRLRDVRWSEELESTQQKMADLLAEEGKGKSQGEGS